MTKRKLRFGTIADSIEGWDKEAETTFFILKEITRRGFENWIMEIGDLYTQGSELYGRAKKVRVTQKRRVFSYQLGETKNLKLRTLDCLFLRKDPPVELEYLNHLTLLELIENKIPYNLLFINSPSGIKKANEKVYPFHFPGISPPTVISQSRDVLSSFVAQHKKVIVKPLNAGGGQGIVILNKSDPDVKSLLEVATGNFTHYAFLQKYIPDAKKGDKRILLLQGEPVGAFLRIPAKGDFRGNMHSGARWVRARVTAYEQKVLKKLKPLLIADGLYFVGVDFIGRYITEINTTSPMGIREVNRLNKVQIEKKMLNWIESKLT